jgi:indolepyruvate ferredoxin oxidoreductase
MATNLLLLGAAFQAGTLPVSAAALEQAIRLNGVSVEMNLLAFRWGRAVVVDAARVEAAARHAARRTVEPKPLSAAARRLVEAAGVDGEARRLLEVRVPDLIEYQDEAYARRYVDVVARVARTEGERTPGRTGLAEAVARHLYKLMAYKDEYEVARLHLDPALRAEIGSVVGPDARVTWHLHPPLLRALGLKRKLRLGEWFTPAFRTLSALRRLRGTPLDVFGYAGIRRVERALIGEYQALIDRALARLGPDTHDAAVALAALPDEIRGYEDIKLESVRRFRALAQDLVARLG